MDDSQLNYERSVEMFDSVLGDCLDLSQRCGNIPSPTNKHHWGSVLFTTLCTRSISLGTLAPGTSWSNELEERWDYASMGILTRSLIETRVAFYYFAIEDCGEVEWNARWNVLNVHDCVTRLAILETVGNPETSQIWQDAKRDLESRLNSNSFFLALPSGVQRRIFQGKVTYLEPMEDIAARAGVSIADFQWYWKFLSSHVHSFPLSYYSISQDSGRGRGIHSDEEEGYASLFLSTAASMLAKSRDEMQVLFAGYARC